MIYTRRFIIEVASHGYKGQEVHSLSSASWRPRTDSGVIQSKSKGLGPKEPLGWILESGGPRARSSDVQEQRKMDIPAQGERKNPPFLCHFVPFRPAVMPTHIR